MSLRRSCSSRTTHRHVPAPVAGRRLCVAAHATAGQQQKIIVEKPTPEKLEEMGVTSWPTWGCGASKFPWSYSSTELAFVLEGEVTVTPDDGGEPVEIRAGDFCTFPEGMSCTWDVRKPINKHYKFL